MPVDWSGHIKSFVNLIGRLKNDINRTRGKHTIPDIFARVFRRFDGSQSL